MSQPQQSWRNHRNHLKKHHPRSPGQPYNGSDCSFNPRSKSNSRGGQAANHHFRGGQQPQQGKYFQQRPRSNSLSLPKGKRAVYGLRSRFEAAGQKELRKSDNFTLHNFEDQQHICQLHSDTLDQCLEKSGIYVCKSYAPRCFIIQKVIFKEFSNKNFVQVRYWIFRKLVPVSYRISILVTVRKLCYRTVTVRLFKQTISLLILFVGWSPSSFDG